MQLIKSNNDNWLALSLYVFPAHLTVWIEWLRQVVTCSQFISLFSPGKRCSYVLSTFHIWSSDTFFLFLFFLCVLIKERPRDESCRNNGCRQWKRERGRGEERKKNAHAANDTAANMVVGALNLITRASMILLCFSLSLSLLRWLCVRVIAQYIYRLHFYIVCGGTHVTCFHCALWHVTDEVFYASSAGHVWVCVLLLSLKKNKTLEKLRERRFILSLDKRITIEKEWVREKTWHKSGWTKNSISSSEKWKSILLLLSPVLELHEARAKEKKREQNKTKKRRKIIHVKYESLTSIRRNQLLFFPSCFDVLVQETLFQAQAIESLAD